jgi:hypothetical protein
MGGTPPGGVKEGLGRALRPDFACRSLRCPIAWLIPRIEANATTPVSSRLRLSSLAWIAFLLLSVGFLVGVARTRARRVDYVSGLAGWSVADPGSSASPAARAAAWQPRLIVPEPSSASYEWLIQTRQMFSSRELRVRHLDYENAPFGVETHAASPYRWILGAVALVDREVGGRPLGASLERAALITDPLLHALLVIAAALLVAWRFGGAAAAVVSLGLAVMFPLAGEFLAGVPDDRGVALAFAVMSVLAVLAGVQASFAGDPRGSQRWLFLGGVAGGVGLWISVSWHGRFRLSRESPWAPSRRPASPGAARNPPRNRRRGAPGRSEGA